MLSRVSGKVLMVARSTAVGIVVFGVVLGVVLCGALAGVCSAEEIVLKDGTKISGTLTGMTADKFQIKTQYGEMSVPRSEVVQITFTENKPTDHDAAKAAKEPIKVDDELNGTHYTNRTVKFTAEVPQGWLLAHEIASDSIAGALKSADQSQIFLVTPEKFDGTVKTYKVLAETQLQGTFGNYKKLEDSEVTIDGKQGVRMVMSGNVKAAGDAPMQMLVYIVPGEGKMVRLSFLTLEPLFADALPVFEKIAKSYKSTK